MAKIIILGAAGSLGRHVTALAVEAGHDVAVVVRNRSKLPAGLPERVRVHECDIAALPLQQLAGLVSGHDALINTAGLVTDGDGFVALVDHVVGAVESIEPAARPACWFLAGAGVLDIGDSARRGVDLAPVRRTYWPHAQNLARLERSLLDWRLLCPGPMTNDPSIGLDRIRVSLDRLPVAVPALARWLPGLALLPVFVSRIPEMIVPYADAASLMLDNLDHGNRMSRHRVGLALPLGLRGKKQRWSPRAEGR